MLSWLIMKRLVLISLAVTLVAVGASCTDDDAADPPPPTTTSPTQADEDALEQLATDWYEMGEAIYAGTAEASGAGNFISGGYLDGFTTKFQKFEDSGNTSRRNSSSSHEIESIKVTGDSARIRECVIDADELLDPSGEVIDDRIVALRYDTTATRLEDGWTLTEREVINEWQGERKCIGE